MAGDMKNSFAAILVFLFCMVSETIYSQQPDRGIKLPFIIEDGDTIPVVNLHAVTIVDSLDPDYYKKLQAYYRLRYNVMKVYPYSKLLAVKLSEINQHLATLQTKKEKRRFMKQAEEGLKNDFEKDLKNFSVSQGKVFTKLIDRETGHSSYELIKDMRGSVKAFFWQNFALIFGQNLKTKYDPEGDDMVIESIVRQIEEGKLQ